MKTTTRTVLAALVSTLALGAVACDQPIGDEGSLRFAPEEVVEMMADKGFEHEAAALLAAVEAGEDIPDQPVPTVELELADDADPVAGFPSLAECLAAYCLSVTPGSTFSGQCVGGPVVYPEYCIILPDAEYALPGCSFYAYEADACSSAPQF
ncbi:MAG: hypothetical protein KC468_04310 [Myxococcales bacterium]|nr:hypothetical protein [Myxococcales bacterium]